MTAFPIIQYLYDNFGGWMAQRNRTRGLAGHADIWEWKLTGERALTLMAELRPFMREPRKTARIDFVLSDAFRTQQGDRSYGSDAKEARRESIYSQFHAL